MTFKKVHRRADLLKKRADLLPLAGTTTTTSSSVAGGPHINPSGPPSVASTPAASTATSAAPSSAPVSSARSTSTPAASTATSAAPSSAPVSSARSTSTPASSTTVPTTPPAAGTSTPNVVASYTPGNLATRSSTITRYVSNTSSSATATTTAANSDSGMGIGSIAGIGVAAIVAIGVASAFVIWLIKRRNKNRDIDEEPFNRNSFMRHSAAIPDDDDSHLPGVVPRPPPTPAMSERNPTPLYGQQNVQFGGGNDFGYATQPSYGAPVGGMYSPNPFGPGGAPATPLPHSPGYGNTYDQGFGGQPGGYQELTRGGPHDYPPSPGLPMENPHSPGYNTGFPIPPSHGHEQDMMHNPHGDGVVRSMTPVGQGQVVSIPDGMHDGHATPVQMGFAPPQQYPQHPQQQGHGPNGAKARPETLYDTDDAYGGI